jgi:N-acetylglucosaminyldiphosphoundecaprenol N-acetyl-beta-D-mannosaminyltransferase
VNIFDIQIPSVSDSELKEKVEKIFSSTESALITYVNVHVLNEAFQSIKLKSIIQTSTFIINDSGGLALLSKLRKNPLSKHTLTDLKELFFSVLLKKDKSVFFLGNEEYVLLKMVEVLKKEYPSLKIAGYHNGFFEINSEESAAILNQIIDSRADVIMVGMGVPKQELWCDLNKERLAGKVLIAGGNCFGYWSETTKRAPKWVRKIYLEWFYRLIAEPRKMFKRYVIGNPLFILRYLYFLVSVK